MPCELVRAQKSMPMSLNEIYSRGPCDILDSLLALKMCGNDQKCRKPLLQVLSGAGVQIAGGHRLLPFCPRCRCAFRLLLLANWWLCPGLAKCFLPILAK